MRSDLDAKEQGHVRTALRYLRRRAGTWAAVARALHIQASTVTGVVYGKDAPGIRTAFRVARLLNAPLDDLLTGRALPGACTRCGHLPDFADEATVVDA